MSTTPPDLAKYKALSLDCYGTLIDWEGGTLSDLSPLLSSSLIPPNHPWKTNPMSAVERLHDISDHLSRSRPDLIYSENLQQSLRQLVSSESGLPPIPEDTVDKLCTIRPGRWPAFEDTVAGLQTLKKYYRLIILSNISNALIRETVAGPLHPVRFDAVYTAETIGSYKPSHENFRYLISHAREDLGIDVSDDEPGGGQLLHVARSLTADHVPAKEVGLPSVWIARGGDVEGRYGTGGNLQQLEEQGKLAFMAKYQTIGAFAEEVERRFSQR